MKGVKCMKSNYEIRAKKFVQKLFPYIKNCYTYTMFYEAIELFNYENRRKVIFSYGMTRCAFITSDYVIKINFARNEDCFDRFGDCESEIDIYEQAKKDGFEYLFAKPTPYYYNEYMEWVRV